MSRRQIIILVVLFLMLLSAIFLYRQSYCHWPWQGGAKLPNSEIALSPLEAQRLKIIEEVARKISELSPQKAVLGGAWFVTRFWFISGSDKDFYVEYEDGHVMGRILVLASQKGQNDLYYDVVASFEAGESDWVLKSGRDTQFGRDLDLYERDESQNAWLRRN